MPEESNTFTLSNPLHGARKPKPPPESSAHHCKCIRGRGEERRAENLEGLWGAGVGWKSCEVWGAARTDGNGNGLKDTCVSPLQLCNIHGSVVDLTP